MIKVIIKTTDNDINEIIVNGHAGFDEYGKDIICAAASTLATASVNHILSLEATIDATINDDVLTIKVNTITDTNQSILVSMINMFEELAMDYPKNIIIKEE